MENEQKTIVSDEDQCVENSADILPPKVIESMQDESSRCDEADVPKAEVEDLEPNKVDEQKLTCDEQDAAIEQTPDESNSGLKGSDVIDEVDHIVVQEEIESIVTQKPYASNDCEADKSLLVPLADSTPESTTVQSAESSEIEIASSNTGCDGEQPSEGFDFEAITTDGVIPMECVLGSSPEKCLRLVDSEVSENDPDTLNLNSSPLRNVRSRIERSVSLSSTDRDIGSGKPNEIFELTDDDEDDENAGRSENRGRRKKIIQSNDFDDDIESDTFDNSSEEDAQSMSDEEPMDDDYDSEERIHSIEDSDEDEVTSAHAVRRINLHLIKFVQYLFYDK